MIPAMRRALGLLSFAAVCAGAGACGASKPEPRHADGCQTVTVEPGHALEVYLTVERDSTRRPLCPGEVLTDRDSLWLSVELEFASHVRVVYIAADGQAGEVLRQDEADLTRSAIFRAPEGLLAHADGEVQLFVVASREPLAESDPIIHAMLNVIRDTGTLVEPDGSLRAPPPGTAPPSDILKFEASENLFANFDELGVAMLAIALRARP